MKTETAARLMRDAAQIQQDLREAQKALVQIRKLALPHSTIDNIAEKALAKTTKTEFVLTDRYEITEKGKEALREEDLE